ncbi:MAG: DNA-processing protein DprA [Collinsella sp.]
MPAISIIGARKASPYGTGAVAGCGVAVEAGVTVVSAARSLRPDLAGCGQRWRQTRRGAGTAPMRVYPLERGSLLRARSIRVARSCRSPRRAWVLAVCLSARNRVIAALSQALFVSEAGMPSGTFSTAEAAMDLGRELLAVPGSILSPESRGTNYLIANGACCIIDEESIEMAISRIYGTLRYSRPDAPGIADLDPTQQTVMHALIASPLKVDDIAALVSLDAVGVLKLLGSLELEGLIERMMDGRYAPSKFALHAQTPLRSQMENVN